LNAPTGTVPVGQVEIAVHIVPGWHVAPPLVPTNVPTFTAPLAILEVVTAPLAIADVPT